MYSSNQTRADIPTAQDNEDDYLDDSNAMPSYALGLIEDFVGDFQNFRKKASMGEFQYIVRNKKRMVPSHTSQSCAQLQSLLHPELARFLTVSPPSLLPRQSRRSRYREHLLPSLLQLV